VYHCIVELYFILELEGRGHLLLDFYIVGTWRIGCDYSSPVRCFSVAVSATV